MVLRTRGVHLEKVIGLLVETDQFEEMRQFVVLSLEILQHEVRQ